MWQDIKQEVALEELHRAARQQQVEPLRQAIQKCRDLDVDENELSEAENLLTILTAKQGEIKA